MENWDYPSSQGWHCLMVHALPRRGGKETAVFGGLSVTVSNCSKHHWYWKNGSRQWIEWEPLLEMITTGNANRHMAKLCSAGEPQAQRSHRSKSLDLCFRQFILLRDREQVLHTKAPGSPEGGAEGSSSNATGEEPQENTGREQQESVRYALFSWQKPPPQ